jgi:starch synthase
LNKISVLHVAAEFFPLSYKGDLGYFINNISKEKNDEIETKICIPFYGNKELFEESLKEAKTILISGYRFTLFKIYKNDIEIFLIQNNKYFSSRADIYGYPDDELRFSLFCLAVTHLLKYMGKVDVINLHDWHTSLISLLVKKEHINIKTVLTIHSFKFQGICDKTIAKILSKSEKMFRIDNIFEHINLLKIGVVYSDKIIIKSLDKLNQLKDKIYRDDLDIFLITNTEKIYAINQGISENLNPEKDDLISNKYSIEDIEGKTFCKTSFQKNAQLNINTEIPIMVIPSINISNQERFLLNSIIPYLSSVELQIIILGNKLADFEKNIKEFFDRRLNSTVVSVENTDENIRKVLSASDIILDISIESSNNRILKKALRYGVIPIIFKESLDLNLEDNKFRLFNFGTEDLINTIKYTINKYYYMDIWNQKVKQIMQYDSSWKKNLSESLEVYKSAMQLIK